MHLKFNRTLVVLGTAAALAAPAVATAKQDGKGKGHGPDRAAVKGPKKPKTKTVILKGLVASVADNVVTVDVKHGNSIGRRLKDSQLMLDVEDAKLKVRDTNGDGQRNVSDVAAGDRFRAQVRIPRGSSIDPAVALVTRKFIDVGPPEADDSDDSTESED